MKTLKTRKETLQTENFEIDIEVMNGKYEYAAFQGTDTKEICKEAMKAGYVFFNQALKRKTGERILIVSKPAVVH